MFDKHKKLKFYVNDWNLDRLVKRTLPCFQCKFDFINFFNSCSEDFENLYNPVTFKETYTTSSKTLPDESLAVLKYTNMDLKKTSENKVIR